MYENLIYKSNQGRNQIELHHDLGKGICITRALSKDSSKIAVATPDENREKDGFCVA